MAIFSIRKALLLTLAASFVLAQEDVSTLPDATADGAPPPKQKEKPKNCNPAPIIQPSNPVSVIPGFEAVVLSNTIQNPRTIDVDAANHFLVLSGADNSVYSMREDACGNVDQQLVLNGSKLGGSSLQDGLIAFREYLYVTTGDVVYRFNYTPGQHSEVQGEPEVVVKNIGEEKLPITIDPKGQLFVPKGFRQAEAGGSRVRQYDLQSIPQGGYDYGNNGQAFQAAGNNGAGPLAYDTQGRIWGANFVGGTENLSLFDENASANTTVPLSAMTSGIAFFRGLGCSVGDADTMGTTVGMPCKWTDHAMLAIRDAGIVHVPYSDLAHAPSGAPETIFGQTDLTECGTKACITPTSLAIDMDGRVLTVSDSTNEVWVFRRIYNAEAGKLLTDKANAAEAAQEAADEATEDDLAEEKGAEAGAPPKEPHAPPADKPEAAPKEPHAPPADKPEAAPKEPHAPPADKPEAAPKEPHAPQADEPEDTPKEPTDAPAAEDGADDAAADGTTVAK